MTQTIVLYTKGHCPFCKNAKILLQAKGVTFTDIEITGNAALAALLYRKFLLVMCMWEAALIWRR